MTTPLVGRSLAAHEQEWLREVEARLRGLPPAERDTARRTAEEHVGDRPATADRAELEAALGRPEEYVALLRAQVAPTAGPARWRLRPAAVVAAVLAVAVIAGGLAGLRWWRGWEATVRAPGMGLRYDDDRPLDGITRTATATSSQVDVAWAADRTVTLEVELETSDRIRVTAVELPLPYASLLEVRAQAAGPTSGLSYQAFGPFDLAPRRGWRVRTRFAFVGCERYGPGSGLVFDHLVVTYEAKGRTRHADVPLGSLLSVTVPLDAPGC